METRKKAQEEGGGKREEKAEKMPETEGEAEIITSENHPITLDMIDEDALFVLRTLNEAGFSGYLVGGGVRDLYLGKKPKDFDISTDARPGQIRKLFKRSTTIGRRFRLVQVFFGGGKTIEVSTLRSLSEYDLDGPVQVLAPNNTFGTLSEDARRRDLTINSLFYEIENETIIDYVRGAEDLKNGIIRIVGDPERRITHDPVRMMRAIRHAARNHFTIDEESWQAIKRNADKLSLCPPSRLRDEFLKDLYSGSSAAWFSRTYLAGVYTTLFPLYRKLLYQNEDARRQLHTIFTVIDRVNRQCVANNVHRQKDFFLLALTLIPWAEHHFQLFSTPRKGANLFKFTGLIREELDNGIGVSLNLRRSLRQEVTSMLIHLALLIHNRNIPEGEEVDGGERDDSLWRESWPNWLKRKSYFAKALLFYQFYLEALSGKITVSEQKGAERQESGEGKGRKREKRTGEEEKLRAAESGETQVEADKEEKSGTVKNVRGRGGRVAYAPNTPGGVFGFLR